MDAGREDADALKGDPHRRSNPTPAREDFAMDVDLDQLLRFRRPLGKMESRADLITCSLCLRVLRGSEWIEAEHVISEIRSYELEAPPRLHAGVCDFCAESIFSRRTRVGEPVAA
jgi:hypothetical protein